MGKDTDFKGYFKQYKSEPSQRRYACFHLLLFIAERFDPETAISMSKNIASEQAIQPYLIEMFNAL